MFPSYFVINQISLKCLINVNIYSNGFVAIFKYWITSCVTSQQLWVPGLCFTKELTVQINECSVITNYLMVILMAVNYRNQLSVN